jgi:hypothetical protein
VALTPGARPLSNGACWLRGAGQWWTHMAYSSDGTRLFSCGVGTGTVDSTLVEWKESDGAISRRYKGFKNALQNLVRFDTAANKYIIVGDEGKVKVGAVAPSTSLLTVCV